jgi:EamA domain-containing membrane protein RarD
MFSILLSVVYFGHHLSLGQWAAVALVFFGIALEAKKPKKATKTAIQQPKSAESVLVQDVSVKKRRGITKKVE